MEFLVNSGAAIMISKTFPLENALYQFFYSPWRRELMEIAVSNIGKPDSTQHLYEFIKKEVYKEEVFQEGVLI